MNHFRSGTFARFRQTVLSVFTIVLVPGISLSSAGERYPDLEAVCEAVLMSPVSYQTIIEVNSKAATAALAADANEVGRLSIPTARGLGPGVHFDKYFEARYTQFSFWPFTIRKRNGIAIKKVASNETKENVALSTGSFRGMKIKEARVTLQAHRSQRNASPDQLHNIRIKDRDRLTFLRWILDETESSGATLEEITAKKAQRVWKPDFWLDAGVRNEGGFGEALSATALYLGSPVAGAFMHGLTQWSFGEVPLSDGLSDAFLYGSGAAIFFGTAAKAFSFVSSERWKMRKVDLQYGFRVIHDAITRQPKAKISFLIERDDGLQVFFVNRPSNLDIYFWYPEGIEGTLPRLPSKKITSTPLLKEKKPEEDRSDDLPETTPEETNAEPPAPLDPDAVRSQSLALLENHVVADTENLTDPTSFGESKDAANKFDRYFQSIDRFLVERSGILDVARLAFLSGQNLLMVGPPGESKSMAADLTLSNVVDEKGEPSYFRIKISEETTEAHLVGQFQPNVLLETGEWQRNLNQGLLRKRHVFFDEYFSGRPRVLDKTLTLMNERIHAEGGEVHQGINETHIAATNTYIPELPDRFRPHLDRFAFSVYIGPDYERAGSVMKLFEDSFDTGRLDDPLTFEEKDQLMKLSRHVDLPTPVALATALIFESMRNDMGSLVQKSKEEYQARIRDDDESADPPIRSTRVYSSRSRVLAGRLLRVTAVDRWIRSSDRESVPTIALGDIGSLEPFLTMSGPSDAIIEERLKVTSDPNERTQLNTIQIERNMFRTTVSDFLHTISESNWTKRYQALSSRWKQTEQDTLNLENEVGLLIEELAAAQPDLSPNGPPIGEYDATTVAAMIVFPQALKLLREITNHP